MERIRALVARLKGSHAAEERDRGVGEVLRELESLRHQGDDLRRLRMLEERQDIMRRRFRDV